MEPWFKDTLQNAGMVTTHPATTRTEQSASSSRAAETNHREELETSHVDSDVVFPLIARILQDRRPGITAVLGPSSKLRASCLARLLGMSRVVVFDPEIENADRYDAAVCIESMPTDQLPTVPSESPETYRRGPNWVSWFCAESDTVRQVASRLAAIRHLVREGGCVILRESLPHVYTALCLARLACEAGLRSTRWAHISLKWSADLLSDGQGSPVLVAEVCPGPIAFREEQVLRGILPPLGKFTLHRLPKAGEGGWLTRSGYEAFLYREWVSQQARELRVRGRSDGGQPFCLHFGVVEHQRAYLYYADTWDARELKVVDILLAWPLFSTALDVLRDAHQRGEARDIQPDLVFLPTALARLLGEQEHYPRKDQGGAS